MAESTRARGNRASQSVRRRSEPLSPGTATLIIVALSLLCWLLLIFLGRGLLCAVFG
jgi:hypothetical protein